MEAIFLRMVAQDAKRQEVERTAKFKHSWQCANFTFAQYRQLVTLIEINIFYIKTSMLCRPLQLYFKLLTDGNKRPKVFL